MNHQIESIFSLYRIGVGPSSSHSMAPARAATVYRGRFPEAKAFEVTLCGSLASTGRGHFTDRVIEQAMAPAGVQFHWLPDATELRHPNQLVFSVPGSDAQPWTVWSVGGGALRDANGLVGAESEPVVYPVCNLGQALDHCRERGWGLWRLVEEVETDVWTRLGHIWTVMQEVIERGVDTQQEERLPGPLGVMRRATRTKARAHSLGELGRTLALIASSALAVSEENASGHTVVTAPTCGSSGILPAVLHFHMTARAAGEKDILKALATAGLVGAVVKANASISGAEVGCQGEVGTACSMAAAAAAQLQGGTLEQIEYAAEMALEHHLGLTCDPVEGYVQIPCIERNMTGALSAVECAAFALLTDGRHLITFDEAVSAMYETGRDLQGAYKETAAGGLAHLWKARNGS